MSASLKGTNQSLDATVNQLSGLLYEAILDESAFPEFMAGLATATGSHFAGLEIVDPKSSNLCRWQTQGAYGLPAETVAGFNAAYGAYNPFVDLVADTATEGSIFTDADVMCRSEFTNQLYYDEFLRHYDFEHISGLYVVHDADISIIVSTSKGKMEGAFRENEIEFFRVVLPHLQRFFRIKQLVETGDANQQASWEIFEQLPHGLILVDDAARVIYINPVAAEIVQEQDGLSIVNRSLEASDYNANRELAGLIGRAARVSASSEGYSSRRDVAVPRARARHPYQVEVIPLAPAGSKAGLRVPAAAIKIYDTRSGFEASQESLMRLYGLTGAEARVAMAIAQGYSIDSISAKLSHSAATTRTLLKRVFSKTDTHRQNELASLVLRKLGDGAEPGQA